MPALEVESQSQAQPQTQAQTQPQQDEAPSQSGPVIGIIYPPPEVRNIVDKTASFVARNGAEFEARIRQNELGNPKFNFLSAGDPYHAYYQHKVKEFREGKGTEPQTLSQGVQRLTVTPAAQQRQQELLKAAIDPPPPKEPPPEYEFIADPPSISALDLDIVKLTAQFVARNGRQFLTNLMNREQRNYQFDFLRPQHSLFQYFTRLLEQYTKVLLPPKELTHKLLEECNDQRTVLTQAKMRAAWLNHQRAQKLKEEQKLERERIAYALIDWHDFVVVETVDYQPMEVGSFPPPTTPEEVGARILMQERLEDGVEEIEMQLDSDNEEDAADEGLAKMEDRTDVREHRPDNTQVQDMEEESSSSDSDDSEPEKEDVRRKQPSVRGGMQPPLLPPQADKIIVKKYDPKAKHQAQSVGASGGEEWLISPITGERIPAHKVQEHMRIGLLDPRWLEQRDRTLSDRGAQDNVLAPGAAIEASLKQLAERRTDIFGVGDEETAIGKKIGEEEVRKDDRVTWDGHTSSVEAATRAARANITLEEQIHQIHKVKGLLPDEEKEKIGPKPVLGAAALQAAQISAPPQPPQPKPQSQMPKLLPPPVVPQMSGILPTMPQVMMVSPMASMASRPPIMGVAPAAGYGYGTPQMAMPQSMSSSVMSQDDEPLAKRARTEDTLIPEAQFLQMHAGQVGFNVAVPNMPDRTEWNLAGQRVPLRLPLTSTVGQLKQKLNQALGMQPAKQKLHLDGLYFKDSNSLAYYNVSPGCTINLQLKERGGRKK